MSSVRILDEEEAFTLEKKLRTLCLQAGEWQVKAERPEERPYCDLIHRNSECFCPYLDRGRAYDNGGLFMWGCNRPKETIVVKGGKI